MTLQEMYLDVAGFPRRLPYDLTEEDQEDEVVQQLTLEWHRLDNSSLRESSMQEEQEREIAHEVEQEREIQRPRTYDALQHGVCPGLTDFIRTGQFPLLSSRGTFQLAFESLQTSSSGQLLERVWPRALLVTDDFTRTVDIPASYISDEYIRDVNWVLTSNTSELKAFLIISPYEANELLPEIRKSTLVTLHVYSPRTSKSMVSFDSLAFCKISADNEVRSWSLSKHSLLFNLFAGQLYLDSFEEYRRLCALLGLLSGYRGHRPDHGLVVSGDGFVKPSSRDMVEWRSPFQRTPLPFLKMLLGMRRRGQNFLLTHMGQIVSGRILKAEDFQGRVEEL